MDVNQQNHSDKDHIHGSIKREIGEETSTTITTDHTHEQFVDK